MTQKSSEDGPTSVLSSSRILRTSDAAGKGLRGHAGHECQGAGCAGSLCAATAAACLSAQSFQARTWGAALSAPSRAPAGALTGAGLRPRVEGRLEGLVHVLSLGSGVVLGQTKIWGVPNAQEDAHASRQTATCPASTQAPEARPAASRHEGVELTSRGMPSGLCRRSAATCFLNAARSADDAGTAPPCAARQSPSARSSSTAEGWHGKIAYGWGRIVLVYLGEVAHLPPARIQPAVDIDTRACWRGRPASRNAAAAAAYQRARACTERRPSPPGRTTPQSPAAPATRAPGAGRPPGRAAARGGGGETREQGCGR